MTYQSQSLLAVFYLLMIVFCWKKFSLLVIALLNLIITSHQCLIGLFQASSSAIVWNSCIFHLAAIFFVLGIVQRQFFTLVWDLVLVPYIITFFRKIVVLPLPVLFAMHLLKTWNVISYTAQVLLLCVKSCLPPPHNYLKIDGIKCASDKKKIDWLLKDITTADLMSNQR